MQENKKLKIGITIGDMNGVGPEIILKTFIDKRMLEFCTPIIYSSTKSLEAIKKHFKYNYTTYSIPEGSYRGGTFLSKDIGNTLETY